jgi:hypothetical protein
MKYIQRVKSRKWRVKSLGVAALLTFTLSTVSAQETVNATSSNASGSGGSASYSVGQVFYTTNTGTNGSEAQGIQHPYEIWVITGFEAAKAISPLVSVYPNPTTDYLTLSIDEFDNSNLSYQLYDISGKLLQNKKITSKQTNIVMSNLVPATYFVRLIQENKEANPVKSYEVDTKQFNVVKTFKIIKTQ